MSIHPGGSLFKRTSLFKGELWELMEESVQDLKLFDEDMEEGGDKIVDITVSSYKETDFQTMVERQRNALLKCEEFKSKISRFRTFQ